jgi:hypothetical protein
VLTHVGDEGETYASVGDKRRYVHGFKEIRELALRNREK